MANQQGWAQQTPAVQTMLSAAMGGMRRAPSRTVSARKKAKRRKANASARGARRSARNSSSGKRPARLVKGSAAAKRYMASIRKKRKA